MSVELKEVRTRESAALPEGWVRIDPSVHLDNPLLNRILRSVDGVIGDSQGVVGFARDLTQSALFIHDQGWIAVDGANAFKADIHGAKWVESGGVFDYAKALFDYFFEDGGIRALVAKIPDHAEGAIEFVEKMGFQPTGFLPLEDTYDGVPHNLKVFVLTRKDDATSDD